MSSDDTDRLEREAQERRSSVNNTIDELRARMSPGQILDEVTDYFGSTQTNAAVQNLGRQVRDNPLALGLVGAGVAWLLLGRGVRDDHSVGHVPYRGETGPSSHSGTGSSGPGIGARVGSAASGVRDGVSSGASSAASGLSSAASAIGDTASSVGQAARDYGSGAADALRGGGQAAADGLRSVGSGAYGVGRRAQRGFLDTLQEEPLIFGAIALAVGAAIGASLPSTRTEDELLGDTRDRLRDQAYAYGKDAVESAKGVAAETYKAASEEADRQGLKPSGEGDTLAQRVSNVVGTATETAKEQVRKEGQA
ncbi:DUF3618 domain-containing protein [Aureimonas psammosilenae]|uniref:DUF3618 domain-containing protein n=1 Tax=Aureimonas psammosilenae TaxID=2495496 RepID=UPI0012604E4F|nr:DUF3618 domain-containing protein [Aureimonas psammosilenae]